MKTATKPKALIGKPALVLALLRGATMVSVPVKLPRWSSGDVADIELDCDGKLLTIARYSGCLSEIEPPYPVGTQLVVKEAWSQDHADFYPHLPLVFRADYGPLEIVKGKVYSPEAKQHFDFRWRSPASMPLHLARLRYVVSTVSAGRVQEVSLVDCAASGAVPTHQADNVWDSTETYRDLWNKINGKDSWEANPWVWRYELRKSE